MGAEINTIAIFGLAGSVLPVETNGGSQRNFRLCPLQLCNYIEMGVVMVMTQEDM